jgi:hypothetical protein
MRQQDKIYITLPKEQKFMNKTIKHLNLSPVMPSNSILDQTRLLKKAGKSSISYLFLSRKTNIISQSITSYYSTPHHSTVHHLKVLVWDGIASHFIVTTMFDAILLIYWYRHKSGFLPQRPLFEPTTTANESFSLG